jgi:hypothetical protein
LRERASDHATNKKQEGDISMMKKGMCAAVLAACIMILAGGASAAEKTVKLKVPEMV